MPEVVIVSMILLWQTMKKVIGMAAIISCTTAPAPCLAGPPPTIWYREYCRGFSCSLRRKPLPVLAHMDWNWKIARVSHAGFTLGITIPKKIRNSPAPSSLADSIRESGSCSINCFIRYSPNP